MRHHARLIIALFLCAFLASCGPGRGEAPRIKEALKKESFDVGEEVRFRLEARAAAGTVFRWTPPEEEIEGVKLEDHKIHTLDKPWGSRLIVDLLLRSFEPGEHEIPVMSVAYMPKGEATWQEALTQPVKFTVKEQVSGEVLELDVKPIKGPLRRRPLLLMILVALLAAAAAGAWLYLWRKRQRALASVPVPPPPAHEIALQKIRELLAKDYISRGLDSQFYYELSLIVREYLEARFGIRAPEMTTEEFLEHLRRGSALEPAHKELLKDFLMHCDLVKFARYEPGRPEIDAAVASARRLIEETKATVTLGPEIETKV